MVGHLAHHQVILLIFSKGFGLPSMVRHVALIFLGCWALIIFALVIHFQLDDHLLFFHVMAHVESGTFPFKLALKFYYSRLFVLDSFLLKVLWYNHIFTFKFFFELFTEAKFCHTSNRCSLQMPHEHIFNLVWV